MKIFYRLDEGFANRYRVAYAESKEEAQAAENAGYYRITRKYALALCAKEAKRRKVDSNFSGYAPTHIFPFWTSEEEICAAFQNPDSRYRFCGRIAEYVGKSPRNKAE